MELHDYIVIRGNDRLPIGTGALGSEPYGLYEGLRSELQLQPSLKEYFRYIDTVVIGTGGQLEWPIAFESMLESAVPTGAAAVFQPAKTTLARQSLVRTVSDDVSTIKAAFGLSMSQLADVMRVQRPTIYTWIDSNRAPETLRKGNRERLRELCMLAETWNRGSQLPPGKYLSAIVNGNFSLLQLLTAQSLDHHAVLHTISAVQAVMRKSDHAQTFGEQLRAMGFADRPSLTRRAKTSES